MKKKLIVVADDYGLSEAYSLGAVKAYKEGIVTVLSLMSNMDAAPFAIDLWKKECPEACLGQHTNFVQGRPVSKDLETMVDENGYFYRSTMWKPLYPGDTKSTGTIVVSYEDAKKETLAQLERHKELTGSYPCHFEGHSVGTPDINRAFEEVSEEMGIHSMSQKAASDKLHYAHELVMDSREYIDLLHQGFTAEAFMDDICGILKSEHEYNVLHFHPGYLDAYVVDNSTLTIPRLRDVQTLTDPRVKQWLIDNDIELTDFRALYK